MDKVKATKLDNPETKCFVYQSSPQQINEELKNYSLSKKEEKYLTKNSLIKYLNQPFTNFLNCYKNELETSKKSLGKAQEQFNRKKLELEKKKEEISHLESEKTTNSKRLEDLNPELSKLVKQKAEIEQKIENRGNVEENLNQTRREITRLNVIIEKDRQEIGGHQRDLASKSEKLLELKALQGKDLPKIDTLNIEIEKLELALAWAQQREEKSLLEGQLETLNNKISAVDAKYQSISALRDNLNNLMEKDYKNELKTMLDDFIEFMNQSSEQGFNFIEQRKRAEETKRRLSELSQFLYNHLYNKSTKDDYFDAMQTLLANSKSKLEQEKNDLEKNIDDFLKMAEVTGLTKEEADTHRGKITPPDHLQRKPGVTFIIDRNKNGDKQYNEFNNDLKNYHEECLLRDKEMKNHFPNLDRYRRLYPKSVFGSLLEGVMWLLPDGLKHDVLEYKYNAKKYLEAREIFHQLATAMYRYCQEEINTIKDEEGNNLIKDKEGNNLIKDKEVISPIKDEIDNKVTSKVKSLEQKLKRLNAEHTTITQKIKAIEAQMKNLPGELKEGEQPNLDSDLLKKSITAKNKEKTNLTQATLSRADAITKLETSIDKIKNDQGTRETEDKVKSKDISDNNEKVKELTKEFEKMQKLVSELSNLKTNLRDNQKRQQALQTEIDEINNKITEIDGILSNLIKEKGGLEQAVQASQEDVAQKKSEKDQLAKQLRKIQSILDKLKRNQKTKEYHYKNVITKIKYITCGHTNKKEKSYKVDQKTYDIVIKCDKDEKEDGTITFYFRAKKKDYLDVNNQQSSGFLTDNNILFDKDYKPIDAYEIMHNGKIQALKPSEDIPDHLFGIHDYKLDVNIEQPTKITVTVQKEKKS